MKALLATVLLGVALVAAAEKADKDKPTQIEANRMSSDEARRMNLFEGGVVLTKGTMSCRWRKRTGLPVAVWVDGEALRIEIDDRKSTIELFDKARITRDGDEVLGNYIFVDQRSDFFSVNAGKDSPSGRVRATIQPKAPTESGKK